MRTEIVHSRPLDVAAIIAEVTAPSNGAVSVFVGTVRETNQGRPVTAIEYSAYSEMAERELRALAQEASEQFATPHVVIEHRTGYVPLAEASVVIAVATPHRAAAMDATRWIIEQLKQRVPIWKMEHYVDGTREWVGQAE